VISECIHLLFSDSRGCVTNDTWTLNQDYVQTVSVNDDDVFLVISLDVGGFRALQQSDEQAPAVGNAQVSFVFDTECSSECEFLFLVVRNMLLTRKLTNLSQQLLNHFLGN
jgi:hypothetical protein